jgi:hypothetical protein
MPPPETEASLIYIMAPFQFYKALLPLLLQRLHYACGFVLLGFFYRHESAGLGAAANFLRFILWLALASPDNDKQITVPN